MPFVKGVTGLFLYSNGGMDMINESKISRFSQTLYNQSKKGAYYTDITHAKLISNLVSFPDDETEFTVLEPSIGDGSAVRAFLDGHPNAKLFGVEVDRIAYEKLNDEKSIDYLINADFLEGVRISNNAFSCCFCNPPYGDCLGQRYESLFLKKLYNYLKNDGLLVFIVPAILPHADEKFCENFTTMFNFVSAFRFHEGEYNKYRQMVILGTKKKQRSVDNNSSSLMFDLIGDCDSLELLPEKYEGKKVRVIASSEKDINLFSPTVVREDDVLNFLKKSSLYSKLENYKVGRVYDIPNPPISPKKDHALLLASTGYTQGEIGEEGQKHLQRGTVIPCTKEYFETDEKGGTTKTVKEYTQTCFVIIENNGEIHRMMS